MTVEKFPRGSANPEFRSPYLDLEPMICDIVRLCEISEDLSIHWLQAPEDEKRGSHAVLMSDVLRERAMSLKGAYYTKFHRTED